jgi:hypothetical protein
LNFRFDEARPEGRLGNWSVDWQAYDAALDQAAAAAEAGHYADAIRRYCHSVRGIMQQLRDHRPTLDSGSGIHPTP